jgi:hypothetical protein
MLNTHLWEVLNTHLCSWEEVLNTHLYCCKKVSQVLKPCINL